MNLTDEQEQRREILFDLLNAMRYQQKPAPQHPFPPVHLVQVVDAHMLSYSTDLDWPLWIHFVDGQLGQFNLLRLIEEGYLDFIPALSYKPDGTWQDQFPPTAYQLTDKAKFIITHRQAWVFNGITKEQS